MTTTRKTILAMIALIVTASGICSAEWNFRGIPVDQGDNLLTSTVFDRERPFFIDVLDQFSNDGPLNGSEADTHQIGFVPPTGGLPSGYLQGQYADQHGRWTAPSGYEVSNGSVQATSAGLGIATTPWRVEVGLGNFYNLEMTAQVAAGESVKLGYFDDEEGEELVLELARTGDDANDLDWTVIWDDAGIRKTANGTTMVAMGEEFSVQLGWLDTGGANDDLFDAAISTSTGDQRLLADSLGNAIDVYTVGFELTGTESSLSNFTSAVPEPNTGLMAIMGIVGLSNIRRRRRRA